VAAVLADPSLVWYCADLARASGMRPRLAGDGGGSLALSGIADSEGKALGHLEISAPARDAFQPEDLALAALLADCCGTVLERATRLEKLVFIDPLTAAYNRSYFELQMEKEMARAQRERGSLALSIVDIDDFKSFNTRYGYQAGNEVLAGVAQALRRGVRPFDTVARWGGEEFAVLLTAPVQPQDVAAVSERLRQLVERQWVTLEGLDRRAHRVSVTVSLGVALYPDHADGAEDLWRAANQALLLAKRPPKNQVVFFREPQQRPMLR
jgi:diguanylate cyclase (GGDEF)-like protein